MRPRVRLKLATSLDGRIAARGTTAPVSHWITGAAARAAVHQFRREVDAIMIGIGTALADDPSLTARDAPAIEGRAPARRVIVDSAARLPLTASVVRTAREIETWVVCAADAPVERVAALVAAGVHQVVVDRGPGGLDLVGVLRALAAAGVAEVLVEGGGVLAGALIDAGLVDELHWFLAPIVLGAHGTPAIVGPTPLTPSEAPRFVLHETGRFGDDVLLNLRRS